MKRFGLLLVVALAGCQPTAEPAQAPLAVNTVAENTARVSVEKLYEFRDDVAYHSTRAVYIIRDKKTGQEFIGVSGIGISETGSHGCGKACTTQDER